VSALELAADGMRAAALALALERVEVVELAICPRCLLRSRRFRSAVDHVCASDVICGWCKQERSARMIVVDQQGSFSVVEPCACRGAR
jgi:hypothetical protein